jgi:hypothetical protein
MITPSQGSLSTPSHAALFACFTIAAQMLMAIAAIPAIADEAPGTSMEVAGRTWVATRSIIYKTAIGKNFALNFNAFLDSAKKSHVSFLIYPAVDGDYLHSFEIKAGAGGKIPTNSGGFNVDMLGGNPFEDDLRIQAGQFVVTKYSPATKTMSGTFSGTARNQTGSATVEIKNGRFTDVDVGP